MFAQAQQAVNQNMAPNKKETLLARALRVISHSRVMKHLSLLTLISALFLAYLLASLRQLVLQAGLSLLAPHADADPAVGACWAVAEPFQLLIYTPGQRVTAKHLLCRAFISLSPFAAMPLHAVTSCRNRFLISSANVILHLHIHSVPSSKLNILGALWGNLLRQENAGQDVVLCRGAARAAPALTVVTETNWLRVSRQQGLGGCSGGCSEYPR